MDCQSTFTFHIKGKTIRIPQPPTSHPAHVLWQSWPEEVLIHRRLLPNLKTTIPISSPQFLRTRRPPTKSHQPRTVLPEHPWRAANPTPAGCGTPPSPIRPAPSHHPLTPRRKKMGWKRPLQLPQFKNTVPEWKEILLGAISCSRKRDAIVLGRSAAGEVCLQWPSVQEVVAVHVPLQLAPRTGGLQASGWWLNERPSATDQTLLRMIPGLGLWLPKQACHAAQLTQVWGEKSYVETHFQSLLKK